MPAAVAVRVKAAVFVLLLREVVQTLLDRLVEFLGDFLELGRLVRLGRGVRFDLREDTCCRQQQTKDQ